MPPYHTLIEIKPYLYRRQRHDSKPSDEPRHPHRPRPWNHALSDHEPPNRGCNRPMTVRPARTQTDTPTSTGS